MWKNILPFYVAWSIKHFYYLLLYFWFFILHLTAVKIWCHLLNSQICAANVLNPLCSPVINAKLSLFYVYFLERSPLSITYHLPPWNFLCKYTIILCLCFSSLQLPSASSIYSASSGTCFLFWRPYSWLPSRSSFLSKRLIRHLFLNHLLIVSWPFSSFITWCKFREFVMLIQKVFEFLLLFTWHTNKCFCF